MKRPLLIAGILYALGILCGEAVPAPAFWVLVAGLTTALGAMAAARWRPKLLCAALFLAGWGNTARQTQALSPHDLRRILGNPPALATVRGVLKETPTARVLLIHDRESYRTMARIEVSAIQTNHAAWQPARGCVAVTTTSALPDCFGGQEVEVSGVIAPPQRALAEGTFDYRAYLRELGIHYHLRAESAADWRVLASPAKPPLTDRFREWGRKSLAAGLPVEDESLRLEWALTLGWRAALTEEVAEPFLQASTYHIFAVDGLRMAIVFGIGFQILRALRVPRPACAAILVPVIWAYVALTGWPASAVRASVMLTVVIGGWVLRRPPELLNSLAAAALIILVWEPGQLFQAGFQLSFLVVLAMILILPPLEAWARRLGAPDPLLPPELHPRWRRTFRLPLRHFSALAATSLAAWVGSLPLAAYYFHLLTPVSTPANIPAVFLCEFVLICNLSTLLLAGWFPAAAELFNHAGWWLMELIRGSTLWFARWPLAWASVSAPHVYSIALFYGLLVATASGWLFQPAGRRWKVAVTALALALWAGQWWWDMCADRLTILPLGGGHGEYWEAPLARSDWLIDCGPTNTVQLLTKPFLQARGVNRLDRLALTHGDVHHVGGAETTATLFHPREIDLSAVKFRSPAYRHAAAQYALTPGLVHSLKPGDRTGPWTVLHPEPEEHFPQADDNALVVRGDFAAARVLLVSDLGRPGQQALLQRGADLRADIVVSGIPTASEPLGDDFLAAVHPRLIVIADAEYPSNERAKPQLRERLARSGTPVLYLRECGAVTLEMRGRGAWIRAMDGTHLRW